MSDRRLRHLADDYAHRRMGTEPYRVARAELLDALVSGETHLEDAGSPPGRGRTASRGLARTRRQLLTAALVVLGVIVSVVLVWALSPTEAPAPPPPTQDATERGPRPVELRLDTRLPHDPVILAAELELQPGVTGPLLDRRDGFQRARARVEPDRGDDRGHGRAGRRSALGGCA